MPLPCGFSNMHGMPMRLQMLKSEMENRKRQLPAVTAACWCAGSPGTPKGCERLRSGPPFLMFCIDVKVVQGVPSQTRRTKPPRTHPLTRLCKRGLSKSCSAPQRMSHSKIGRPWRRAARRKLLEKAPPPEKISSAHGPWAWTKATSSLRGLRQ